MAEVGSLLDPTPLDRLRAFKEKVLEFEQELHAVEDTDEALTAAFAGLWAKYNRLDQEYQNLINETAEAQGNALNYERSDIPELLRRCRSLLHVRWGVPFAQHLMDPDDYDTNTNQEGGRRRRKAKRSRKLKKKVRKTRKNEQRRKRKNYRR